jgi:hypothetical protein
VLSCSSRYALKVAFLLCVYRAPASKLHVHSVNYAAKLVHTRCALSSTLLSLLIRRQFQVKPATLLILIDFFLSFWWRSYTVPGIKVAPFPLLMRGVVFHCQRSLFFSFCTGHTLADMHIGRVGQIRIRIIIRIIRYGICTVFSSLPPPYPNSGFPYIRIYTAYFCIKIRCKTVLRIVHPQTQV